MDKEKRKCYNAINFVCSFSFTDTLEVIQAIATHPDPATAKLLKIGE